MTKQKPVNTDKQIADQVLNASTRTLQIQPDRT